MMVKLIPPHSWDWGDASSELVKISSRGLIGNDFEHLVKRASHVFADKVANLQLYPGEVPVHLIALGSTEGWGPNRNGDGFPEKVCQAYHDTFVKNARAYRHHRNKDPRRSYGVVKLSAYNPNMRRVELLVALNSTKEAAERNGGLVADEEMEKLSAGKDISVSMACTVPFDVSSCCNHKAASRADYCTAETCPYGGCKANLGKVASDGHHMHVANTIPNWFDISYVGRPADATAQGNIADYLKRAAATDHLYGGAELAEKMGMVAPFQFSHSLVRGTPNERLYTLALEAADAENEVEQQIKAGHELPEQQSIPITRLEFGRALGNHGIQEPGTFAKAASALAALADAQVLLPLHEFMTFLVGEKQAAELYPSVQARLPGVFSRMVDDTRSLDAAVNGNPFDPSRVFSIPDSQRTWAHKAAQHYSLEPSLTRQRTVRHLVNGRAPLAINTPPKLASFGDDEGYARAYAAYQLALLSRLEQKQADFPLTVRCVVRHNYIDVPAFDCR